jgi:uncharacterized membrane protein
MIERLEVHTFSRSEVRILIILFVLSIALRIIRLFDLDVWLDEVAILFQIDKTFTEIWSFCQTENFPPFYPWLVKVWSWGGSNAAWFRFLSVLIGSMIPLVCYCIGKELNVKKLSLLLGMAAALSVPLIFYSQNVRMYSLFVLLSCLSYLGFIKAMKSNRWEHWLLMAIANLVGFYTFLFMALIILTEFLYLVVRYRVKISSFARSLIAHVPVFFLTLFWIVPLLERYAYLHEQNTLHLTIGTLIKFAFYLGTGTDFLGFYILAFLLNIPFFIGFMLSIPLWLKKPQYSALAWIFCISILIVCISSMVGQRILYGRYLIFLLPIYLLLVLSGYLRIRNKLISYIGISSVFVVLIFSISYYFVNFYAVNDQFRYLWYEVERVEGHSFSLIAKEVEDQIAEHEIIIHYSDPSIRSFSFFPILYYHGRKLPEYIYSKNDLPQYSGQQYLKPGELLRSLEDLDELPKGIWIITLNSLEFLSEYNTLTETMRPSWFHRENLLSELDHIGYRHDQSLSIGNVSSVHFVQVSEEENQTGKESNFLE